MSYLHKASLDRIILTFEKRLQVRERFVCGRWHAGGFVPSGRIQMPRMLRVVTVKAKEFPVAAIGWVIFVIAILVMHGEHP